MAGLDPTDFNRWLRQRRAIRASRAGRSDFRWDDFYDDYGEPTEHDPDKYRVALRTIKIGFGAAAVIIAIVVVSLARGGGSDDAEVITTTTAAATTTTLAPTTTTLAAVDLPGPMSDVVAHLDLTPSEIRRAVIFDAIRDHIGSVSDEDPGYTGGDIDIVRAIIYGALSIGQVAVDNAFNNSVYECGATTPVVVCPPDVLDMPAGDILIVAVEHDAPIPTASTERSFIYSVVFDSDGDPANDWVFRPPFDWDFFIGTDRWYQAAYSHTTGTWQINAVQVQGDQSTRVIPTAARAVIDGEWVIWFIPANEFPLWPPPVRATAFAHDGSFGEATRGGDVTGANPTEPLFVFDFAP